MSDIRFNQWLHQSGTGGVSQVASGAVGVGTTNPLADFYVRGDAQITGILTAGHIAMGSSITFGDDDRAYFGDGTDLQIYHSGSDSFIQDTGTGDLKIRSSNVRIEDTSGNLIINASPTSAYLYSSGNAKLGTAGWGAQVTGILKVLDSTDSGGSTNNLSIGTGNDLKLFHDSSHSYISNSTGHLTVTSSQINLNNAANTKNSAIFRGDSNVELYYNHTKRFETTNTGAVVTGILTATTGTFSSTLQVGSGADVGNIIQMTGADTTSEILEAGIVSGHVQFTASYASGGNNSCGFIFRTRNGSSGTNEKVRITSAGRVGINETSPDGELHIKGTNPFIYLEGTNGSGRQHKIWSAGTNSESLQLSSGNILYNGDVHYFRASNESTEYARIDTSGRLLLNRTSTYASSSERLSVNGMTSIQGSSTSAANLYIFNTDTTGSGTVQPYIFLHDGSGIRGGIGLQYSTANFVLNAVNDFQFRTGASGVNGTERLRIDSIGRLGIQGAPTRALLEVRASGGSNTMLTALWGANEGTTAGTLSDNTDKAVRMGIQHYDTDALPYAFLVGSSGSSANNLTFGGGTSLMNAATEIKFNTAANQTTASGTERLRIKSDGKVVIGNSNGSGTGALTIYPNSITGNGRLDVYGGGDENSQTQSKCEVMRIGRGDILDQYYHSIWSATGSGGATSHFLKFYVSNGTAGATNQLEALSMNGNGIVTKPAHPSFHARYTNNVSATQNPLVYDAVHHNNGSHYKSSGTDQGKFVAPVSGVYLFYWTAIKTSSGTVTRLYINVDGSHIYSNMHLRLQEQGNYSNGSMQAIVNLNAGQKVHISLEVGSIHGNEYTHFGGYLIG